MKSGLDELRVLLIDDNRYSRNLTRGILDALGIKQVREAGGGTDGLQKFQFFPADLVLCEMNMAAMGGIEFAARVRTGPESPNPYVPIVLTTGPVEMARIVEARDAGVHEILVKPISVKAVGERIADLFANPRPFARSETYFGPVHRPQNRRSPASVIALAS